MLEINCNEKKTAIFNNNTNSYREKYIYLYLVWVCVITKQKTRKKHRFSNRSVHTGIVNHFVRLRTRFNWWKLQFYYPILFLVNVRESNSILSKNKQNNYNEKKNPKKELKLKRFAFVQCDQQFIWPLDNNYFDKHFSLNFSEKKVLHSFFGCEQMFIFLACVVFTW